MNIRIIGKLICIATLTAGLAAPALANNNPSLFNKLKGSLSRNETAEPYSFSKGKNGDNYPAFSETERKALQEQLDAEHRIQIAALQDQVLAQYMAAANSGVAIQSNRQSAVRSNSASNAKRIYQLNKSSETDKKPERLYNVPD